MTGKKSVKPESNYMSNKIKFIPVDDREKSLVTLASLENNPKVRYNFVPNELNSWLYMYLGDEDPIIHDNTLLSSFFGKYLVEDPSNPNLLLADSNKGYYVLNVGEEKAAEVIQNHDSEIEKEDFSVSKLNDFIIPKTFSPSESLDQLFSLAYSGEHTLYDYDVYYDLLEDTSSLNETFVLNHLTNLAESKDTPPSDFLVVTNGYDANFLNLGVDVVSYIINTISNTSKFPENFDGIKDKKLRDLLNEKNSNHAPAFSRENKKTK